MRVDGNSSALSMQSVRKKLFPGLILGVLVLVGLALLGDLRQVQKSILTFDWRLYPLALLFTLGNYTLRFIKWHFYLGQIGIRKFSPAESLRLFVAGFPLAVTPGKVGEVLKGVWLNQKTGVPVGRAISVVVAERISDGMAVLMLSVAGILAYPRYWPAFALILALLLSVIVISQIRPAALAVLGWIERLPLANRAAHGLREFYEGSYTLFRPGPTLLAVGLGTISWLGEGIGFYLILLGLGLPQSLQLAATAVFILAFATVIGAVSALPGGLGASEASIAGMLTLLLGLEPATATTATLLIRLATLWFGVGLGILTWIFSPDLLGLREMHGTLVES
ncbi:conserved hypothetical protein [Longilinea arvoryzae]|uniref:Integral membrane protein n=1 Tax=Longilinea arvoryzae TaxID=360412 RepID=A0A0S7B9E9_9CHLR|nr:lysylphosphatidylglycerol synthase transmembrane domain-containing protein [Longilinea arvoryzae]GAP14111.1 conserved hypothetical protein [Longilinea arvoryzae]